MIFLVYSVHTRLEAGKTMTEQEGDRKVTFLAPRGTKKETEFPVRIFLFVERKLTLQWILLVNRFELSGRVFFHGKSCDGRDGR